MAESLTNTPLVLAVFEVVAALAEVDAGVMAGEIALGVRQGPVIVKRTADAAPGNAHHDAGPGTQLLPLTADDFKAQRHGRSEPSLTNLNYNGARLEASGRIPGRLCHHTTFSRSCS